MAKFQTGESMPSSITKALIAIVRVAVGLVSLGFLALLCLPPIPSELVEEPLPFPHRAVIMGVFAAVAFGCVVPGARKTKFYISIFLGLIACSTVVAQWRWGS